MKKLLLDDLRVESFSTTDLPDRRGTVMGHATELADSCGMGCGTVAPMESCGPAYCGDSHAQATCPGTGGGTGASECTLCGSRDCSADTCTGPYGCPCTTTLSYDYTFCEFHSTCINC